MVKTKNVVKAYSGEWAEYSVDTEALSLQEKLFRISELEKLSLSSTKNKNKRFMWLLIPILFSLYLLVILRTGSIFSSKLGSIILTTLFVELSGFILPMYDNNAEKRKYSLTKIFASFVLWIPVLTFPKHMYAPNIFILFSFIFTLILSIIYIILSRRGFQEIIDNANKEKIYLVNEVTKQIDFGMLEPQALKKGVILSKNEVALLEVDATIVEIKEKISQPITLSNMFSKNPYNVIFKHPNLDRKGIIRNVNKSSFNSSDANGRLIVTYDRLLFIDSTYGFQIYFKDLITCGLNPDYADTISFQSNNSIYTLKTDIGYWIKKYVERIIMTRKQK